MHMLLPEEIDQLFILLMDHLPIGVVVVDDDYRLRYINPRHAQLNQLQVEQQIGKPLREYLPHAADVIEPKLRFVFDSGIPLINQEIRSTKPSSDGRYLHRLASYYPYKKDGKVVYVVGVVQDASIDHFAGILLEEAQQRLLRVLDNLIAFVGVLDLDGTLTDANQAPLIAAGLSIDQVKGKKFWDCYWWSYDPQLQSALQSAIVRCREGEVVRFDAPVRMINDTRMWIDFMLSPLRDKDGHVTHLIPSGVDINSRHQAEIALHESEERYRSVIESSDDAIITKSIHGIITGWNPAAERLLGYTAAEAIGQPVTMLFPPSRLAEEAEILQRILAGERLASFETKRIHKSGAELDISVTISPMRDRNGVVIGACKLARDISVQKQQRLLLETALEEKTALLHEVHHRVKNNLQIVSSLLHLQTRTATAEVAKIISETQGRIKAMAMAHQLLYESSSLSKIGLSAFLNQLVTLSKATYGEHDSGFELTMKAPQEEIRLDVQRLIACGLIVNELILNAVKHAGQEHMPVHIGVDVQWSSKGIIQLSVSDDGRGLPAHFSWGKNGGLGSQLIPLFVSQLEGEIVTESKPGNTVFTISFPY